MISTLKNEHLYIEIKEKTSVKISEIRTDWHTKVANLIEKSRDFENLSDVQVSLLSYRHQLTEYCYGDLAKALIQTQSFYSKNRKTALIETKTNLDIKLSTEKEKFIVIDSDIRVIEEIIELVESQISYVKETIKLLDSLGFSIKSRIEMYKLINGEH